MLGLLQDVLVVNVFWFLIGILFISKDVGDKLHHLPMYKIAIVFCIYLSPLFTALLFTVAFVYTLWKTFSDWLYGEK